MILNISHHIYQVLSSDASLALLIGGRIFPLATKNEVTFPFIVYQRDSVAVEYDKASRQYATIVATVYVLADSYTESVAIAEAVIDALEKKKAVYSGFSVEDCEVSSVAEGYENNTFVQQVSFEFFIKDGN